MKIDWSKQQKAIFEWFATGNSRQNSSPLPLDPPRGPAEALIVRARAGTGKTTSIMEAVTRAPEMTNGSRVMLCAFNKSIAEELGNRLVSQGLRGAEAATLHSIGFRALKRQWGNCRPIFTGKRAWGLSELAAPGAPDPIISQISKLHTLGRECVPFAESGPELHELCSTHDLEPDPEWKDQGWTKTTVCQAAFRAMKLAAKRPAGGEIDFSDMLFLPLVNKMFKPAYGLVVVDEAQDMNPAQLLIAQRICAGRFVAVGDDRQGIYAFRGADCDALDRLKAAFKAKELGLTTTYRCGTRIVDIAKQWVPDFEAGPSNPPGDVIEIAREKVVDELEVGDAVLSRINAPLIGGCLKAIIAGKPAMVKGRDVAAGIKALIKQLAKGPARNSMPIFIDRVVSWEEREIKKAMRLDKHRRDAKVESVADRAECLLILCDGLGSIGELQARIDRIFKEIAQGRCITFSSVHKAKGLEWDRVFILRDTLRESDQQECNISYVAVTRAKSTLFWVLAKAKG